MTTTSWFDQWCGTTFMPHGQCYLWDGNLVRLHTVSDSLIAIAYFSIPFLLIYFVKRRRDLPYPAIFLLFGAFIVACGTTHIMEVVTIWHPVYWLSGGIKLITAAISLVSAVALLRIMPQALALPSPRQLHELNAALEERVEARTADLSKANVELRREIDQRLHAEAEVQRLNASLQKRFDEMKALFDLLPVGVGIANDSGCREIQSNRALAAMLGLPPEANASLTAAAREAPSNFKVYAQDRELRPDELPMQVAARENRPVLDFEERIERIDGAKLHVLASAVPLQDKHGNCNGCVATFQDITGHKQMADELRLVVEAAPSALIMADESGTITLVNSQTEALFGYARSELLGQKVEMLIPVPSRTAHVGHRSGFFSSPSARAMGAGRELYGRRKDGSEVPIEIGLNPIRTSVGLVVLAAIIDITERKRVERNERALTQKLLEAQKLESLGILAGGIAHDFNNLLTGILGNVGLARRELPSNVPTLHRLGQIEVVTHRAAELCKQMLAYSGRGRFVVERLDLNRVIEETARLLTASISKRCTLRFELGSALPAISADATQIRQLIMNLIINASEAIGERDGLIVLTTMVRRVDSAYLATQLHSEQVAPGDYVYFEISDNGCGMDQPTLKKIFDPFFTTKFTGRGLGLAAALGIIRGHKGALNVFSEPGRGTKFEILLPGCEGSVDRPATDEQEIEPDWRGHGRVLVVDDEESVRVVSANILETLGFSVTTAADGREAVEKFSREPGNYALVLLDLTMPQMDGREAFTHMRRINPAAKVVLMSGFDQRDATSGFAGQGLAGFLQKPFTNTGVAAAVRAALLQD